MHVRPIVISDGSPGAVCARCDVRGQSVCNAIADSDLGRLAACAVRIDFKRGQTVISEGEPAADFFNVTSGTVKLYKLLPDGRQQITGFASTGYFLGLAVSIAYAFSAEAVEDVRLCRFSRVKLRRLLDDFPALQKRLLETACNELASAQEQMLLLGRKTATEKVASFLMAWSLAGAPCATGDHVHLPMTRGEIADYLGLTIETVSRIFSRFRAGNRIQTPSPDEIVLLDRAWLTGVAEGRPAFH
jgi:CRP/FNR family transcriptional regulator